MPVLTVALRRTAYRVRPDVARERIGLKYQDRVVPHGRGTVAFVACRGV